MDKCSFWAMSAAAAMVNAGTHDGAASDAARKADALCDEYVKRFGRFEADEAPGVTNASDADAS